ncbi:hypothetical protein KAI92_04660 [Candidatus Parcubacteria bacterium]|nr:hypothetical protein [Candidatus Parcubacteria bacterium]
MSRCFDTPQQGVCTMIKNRAWDMIINKDMPQQGAYTMNDTPRRGACTDNQNV